MSSEATTAGPTHHSIVGSSVPLPPSPSPHPLPDPGTMYVHHPRADDADGHMITAHPPLDDDDETNQAVVTKNAETMHAEAWLVTSR